MRIKKTARNGKFANGFGRNSDKQTIIPASIITMIGGNVNESLVVADSTVMDAAYEEMELAAQDMDSDRLDAVFDEMKGYGIPEEEQELFGKLEKAAYNLDYDMVLELLKERNP